MKTNNRKPMTPECRKGWEDAYADLKKMADDIDRTEAKLTPEQKANRKTMQVRIVASN